MQNSHLPIPLHTGYRLQKWYRIDRVLGQGSCGVTYEAHDCNLERTVAIKEYLPIELAVRDSGVFVQASEACGEDAYHIGLEAFLNEARLLAKVEHPNTPSIINVFVAQNTAYVVMSYEEGESLETLLQLRRTLEEAELLQLLLPLLGVLEKVHENGHIHGDISPSHILLRGDGSPVLIDFGATRRAVAEQTHSAINISPGYSPPEAYFGKREQLGASSDLYGLAATLYRAVAGVAPADALQRSQAVIGAAPDPLLPCVQLGAQRYSDNLLQAIDCALDLDPGKRPQSVAAWRREFGSSPGIWLSSASSRREEESAPLGSARAPGPTNLARAGLVTAGVLAIALLALAARTWFSRHDLAEVPDSTTKPAPTLTTATSTPSPKPALPTTSRATPVPAPSPTVAAAASPAVEQTVDDKVSALLAEARANVSNGHLVSPEEDNALDKYRAIQALRPGMPEAKEGLQQIADELVRLAQAAMEKHDLTAAQAHLDRAGSVLPDGAGLAAARKELLARKLEASKPRQAPEKPATVASSVARLAASARRSISRKQWQSAASDIDQIALLMPDSAELPELRAALQSARQSVAETPPPISADNAAILRKVQGLIKQAGREMERRRWETAQSYVDKARELMPDAEDIALLQGELNLRQAAAQEPVTAAGSSVPPGATEARPDAAAAQGSEQVEIRRVSVSVPIAHPGQSVDFVTEYVLKISGGEPDRAVIATWALIHNGRRLGQEGSTSILAKAGPHSTNTQLIIPAYMKAGTYVVEHKVVAGRSQAVARSSFQVAAD